MNPDDLPTPAEIYASSLYRGLDGDAERTRAVDWIGGMGFAENLGRLIHRLRGHDASAFRPAVHALVDRLEAHNRRRIRIRPQVLPALAAFVIRAHIASLCPICSGRGKLAVERDGSGERRLEEDCRRCGGGGQLSPRWRDFDGWPVEAGAGKCEEVFTLAVGILERADGAASRVMRVQVRELSA